MIQSLLILKPMILFISDAWSFFFLGEMLKFIYQIL